MVTTTSGAQLWSYPMGAAGLPDDRAGAVVCAFEGGWPDGMAVRADGTSWVALTGGHRLDLVGEEGEILDAVILADGALPTNVCLCPDSADEMLVTASFHQALLRIRLPHRG